MDRRQMLQLAAGAAAGILTGGMHVPFSQETLYPEWCDKRLWRHQATSGKLVRDVQADLGLPGAAMPSNRNWHTLEMGPTPLLRLSGSRAVREFARSYGVGVTDLPNRTFMGRLFPRMFSESDAAGWWHNEPAWMDKARLKNKRGTQVLQDQRASAVVGLCSAKDLKNYEIDMGGGVVLPKGLELMPPHDCVSRQEKHECLVAMRVFAGEVQTRRYGVEHYWGTWISLVRTDEDVRRFNTGQLPALSPQQYSDDTATARHTPLFGLVRVVDGRQDQGMQFTGLGLECHPEVGDRCILCVRVTHQLPLLYALEAASPIKVKAVHERLTKA